MSDIKKILILGGGQAAVYAAYEIRKHDTHSVISIFSEENYLPYERPPLSKDFLMNKKKDEELLFFSDDFFKNKKINYVNNKIIKVNFDNKLIISKNKIEYSYDKLLITTGSTNRKLKINNEIDNDILYLRNLDDAKKIKDKILNLNKIAIIGGGFIGLEIASSLSQQNKTINIIEISNQLMGRIIPSQIANLVKDKHKKNGSKLYINTKIKNIQKKEQSFKIFLEDNTLIEAEIIIGGIGSFPSVELFTDTDLKIENGILTDEFCQTSIKDVYAAGDVSNFYHPFYKKNIRLESYQHAQNHGINAGKNIAGIKTEYNSIPWMWSDQFNLNLQLTGLCDNYDNVIKRGDNIENGIVYFFMKNEKINGACGLGLMGNIGRDIRIASKLIEKNIVVDTNILVNQNQKLNILIKK
jgi:3-phenylpropionate/trans-cinnamate dioxygenase ferredoxin reductase subunit|tara:strand:- start:7663 stop:8898 length:1236 start_codon:yes stop_codon:yes gene_type:complete